MSTHEARTGSHEPVDEGITIERRSVLWIPVAMSASAVLGAPLAAHESAAPQSAFSPLTREEFGERWQALASAIRAAPAASDESYAMQLAGLVARVPIEALPRLEKAKGEKGVTGGPSWFLVPCVMVEFRLEPGAALRCHNHPPQIVLTLCAEGEALYRHLEIDGDAPPCTEIDGREFRVRETRAGILRPGQTTSLTRTRDGIHAFVGGKKGACVIDFTLSLTDDVETFSYVALSEQPVDAQRRTYGATWLGKRA